MQEPSGLSDCLAELRKSVAGDLRSDRYSRILYSTDASIYEVEPYAVLIPRHAEDIHAAVDLASRFEIPLLPRTAGTSLAGQAVNQALVIDMTRHLDEILELDVEARLVRVQPGISLERLNTRLRPHGLQYGPDPASGDRAAMGGIVGNNATGAHSILYGMTADHVRSMQVILSDGTQACFDALEPATLEERHRRSGLEGEIYRRLTALVQDEANQSIIRAGTPRHWRRRGGYNLDRFVDGDLTFKIPRDRRFNLANMVCGSEGTLAVMTDITLGLVPLPRRTALALVHFDSLHEALTSVPVILQADVSAVELLDQLAMRLCREVPEYSRLLQTFTEGDPNAILIVEFQGETEAELRANIKNLKALLWREKAGATSTAEALDPQLQRNVWKVRKGGLGLLMSIKGDRKPIPFIEDAAVPVEHLAEYISRIEAFCDEVGTEVAYYAHASAGCLHVRPLIDAKQASEVAKLPEILSFSAELVSGYGGSLSSEHGDGRARSWINERFFGPELYGLYKQVKQIFDPRNLLNPGNIVEAPEMTESLRFGRTYEARLPSTQLDFRHDLGLDRAIEMCNGAGACRKPDGGTMCPSFMATREEEHSTRGRANALRAVLSGHLPTSEWTSKRMYEVMDLCVACKACMAECPSSVDMGKIRFDFLARYNSVHGTPLRAELLGHMADLDRFFSGPLAGIANASMRALPVRYAMEKILGISRQRMLPAFAREPFTTWFENRLAPSENRLAPRGSVVLFNDTWNTYNTPRVSIAATEVLETAGFAVLLPGHGCCGRPLISKGLLEEARLAALDTVNRLAPLAERGLPIVGLEPSCLLTLRDEYHYLLPEDPRVDRIAERAVTFEEFLARLADRHELDLRFTQETRQLLLHGHCHEKALVGTAPSHQALSLPTGYEVQEVDSGCCGMAGAFGYEAEHYEISMKMADRSLLPAIRDAGPDTVIVAAGISCRQQIEHGTGRQALHPAEVLRHALTENRNEVQRAD
jgi:FAD/FMN-containing dehydrogenase/Fe-S oxidoreductase